DLPIPEILDGRIVCGPLDSTVPAPVVVGSVAVPFSVVLVVLPVIGDQVVEGEAVVACDEVDALLRLTLLVTVDLGAAHQPVREPPDRAGLAPEEGPHVVAEAAVPLLPAIPDEAADLIQAPGVPGLSDELRPGEDWIRFDVPEDGRVRQGAGPGLAGDERPEGGEGHRQR